MTKLLVLRLELVEERELWGEAGGRWKGGFNATAGPELSAMFMPVGTYFVFVEVQIVFSFPVPISVVPMQFQPCSSSSSRRLLLRGSRLGAWAGSQRREAGPPQSPGPQLPQAKRPVQPVPAWHGLPTGPSEEIQVVFQFFFSCS